MNENGKQDLLILGCSATKRRTSHSLPAIQLYDGPAYRVLRKRLKIRGGRPTIWVLSAKYGLVKANHLITAYDAKMNRRRAQELRNQVEKFIERFAPPGRFNGIFIWAGKEYLAALPTSFLARCSVHVAEGRIGEKLKLLKEWCNNWST